MSTVALKKGKSSDITVVRKMKDYSKAPVFKKKAEKSVEFLKKSGLPKGFVRDKDKS